MDIAVVTGASSGLGLAISRKLLSLGFRVYGLGGNYQDHPLQNVEFRPIPCDLADPAMVEHRGREILEREGAVSILVNNAKLFPADTLEAGAGAEFTRSLNVNLLCPLILVRTFLPALQQVGGKVITISSATPETSRGGPAGAASAGGLRWMQEALFQEFRDFGITFSTVSPEPNRWRPSDAPPAQREHPQSVINPAAVADAVGDIVLNTKGNVATEIVLRPERLTENKISPMREVPYPKPQPIPYTVPRELLEAEEQLDRQDEERSGEFPGAIEEDEAPKKRRRRRRRREKDDHETEKDDRKQGDTDRSAPEKSRSGRQPREQRKPREQSGHGPRPTGQPGEVTASGVPTEASPRQEPTESPPADHSKSRRRRRGRKPRPASREERSPVSHEPRPGPVEVTPSAARTSPRPAHETEHKAKAPAEKPAATNAEGPPAASKTAEPPTKPRKKAAKKATTKTATKKRTAKKAAPKKSATKKTTTKKAARKTTKKVTKKKLARKTVAKEAKPESE